MFRLPWNPESPAAAVENPGDRKLDSDLPKAKKKTSAEKPPAPARPIRSSTSSPGIGGDPAPGPAPAKTCPPEPWAGADCPLPAGLDPAPLGLALPALLGARPVAGRLVAELGTCTGGGGTGGTAGGGGRGGGGGGGGVGVVTVTGTVTVGIVVVTGGGGGGGSGTLIDGSVTVSSWISPTAIASTAK